MRAQCFQISCHFGCWPFLWLSPVAHLRKQLFVVTDGSSIRGMVTNVENRKAQWLPFNCWLLASDGCIGLWSAGSLSSLSGNENCEIGSSVFCKCWRTDWTCPCREPECPLLTAFLLAKKIEAVWFPSEFSCGFRLENAVFFLTGESQGSFWSFWRSC